MVHSKSQPLPLPSRLLMLLALPLVACGSPEPEPGPTLEPTPTPAPTESPWAPVPTTDLDGDGHPYEHGDCDDLDPAVYPGALEVCDGKDNNCYYGVDEGVGIYSYPDVDQDGFGPIEASVYTCALLEGHTDTAGDCDDANPEVKPGALELCDGIDNDCDSNVDEEETYYRDGDGDGFGRPLGSITACTAPEGYPVEYTRAGGDCDDTNPDIYPGAEDIDEDGIDSDCGGTDAPQPSVGLPESTSETIQAALNAAQAGETVWVGPGTYLEHTLDFKGKAVELESTHGADFTTINAHEKGAGFIFLSNEGAKTVIRGLTITQANNYYGAIEMYRGFATLDRLVLRDNRGTITAGIYVASAAPTFTGVTIARNVAPGDGMFYLDTFLFVGGTGILASSAQPTLRDCRIVQNHGEWAGGGLGAVGSTVILERTTVSDNYAEWEGGGIYAYDSDLTLTDSDLSRNISDYTHGGGIMSYGSAVSLSRCTLTDNISDENGGAIALKTGSSLTLTSSTLSGNIAGAGAAISAIETPVSITQSALIGNRAFYEGGAVRMIDASKLTLTHSLVLGNSAGEGGGIQLADSTAPVADLHSTLLAYNSGGNLVATASNLAAVNITYNAFFQPYGVQMDLSPLDPSNLIVKPELVTYRNGVDSEHNDFHLRPGSALIDAGAPSVKDPDGSRSDIGLYSGPGADFDYYTDADSDGLYDGWEKVHGTDPTVPDAGLDPEGDGLTHREELLHSADPQQADTDGDGLTDGAEVAGDSDPGDWFSRPNGEVATARIPADFPTLQAGIDRIQAAGVLELAPGTYRENVLISNRKVRLTSTAGADQTLLEGRYYAPVLRVQGAEVDLQGLTITGGSANIAGGLAMTSSVGQLQEVVITGNTALEAGGVYLRNSSPTFIDCVISANSTPDGTGSGGGLALDHSSPTFVGTLIEDNETDYQGGGLALTNGSHPTFYGCMLQGNRATGPYGEGGAIHAIESSVTLTYSLISSNAAEQSGGGIHLENLSTAHLTQSVLEDNVTTGNGGGMRVVEGDVSLEYCRITNNIGNDGGGLCLSGTSQIRHSLFSGNQAVTGGGLSVTGTATLSYCAFTGNNAEGLRVWGPEADQVSVENTILAHNFGYNLFNGAIDRTAPGVVYSNLYNAGKLNHNLLTLDASNSTFEPGFLAYSQELPSDWHLSESSSLIDAGTTSELDVDGTRADMGIYGGPDGDGWDLDGDGYFDYFWPGAFADAPLGVDTAGYDCDDGDASIPSEGKACPAP